MKVTPVIVNGILGFNLHQVKARQQDREAIEYGLGKGTLHIASPKKNFFGLRDKTEEVVGCS